MISDLPIKSVIANGKEIPLKEPTGTLLIEENGNFDVTNYANAEVNVGVVKPSGIKTITENGEYDVTNYAWANVNVQPALTEKDIIGKWVYESVESGINFYLEFKDDGKCIIDVSGDIIEIPYSISGSQILLSGGDETVVAEYDNNNDTISLDLTGSGTPLPFTRLGTTLITKEITENGTYKASDDGADGYSEVVVNVASSGGGGSGERDVHETLYIMKAIDNMRFEDKQIAFREFPTEEEYAEQETYINNMIKNITGVDFNG